VTAATGLDALTQLLEAFVSSKASPFTDGFCREGLARGARALPVAFRNGEDLEARADMALASLFSGIALANAGLGAVHGFAGSLGGLLGAPHGALCATLLPHVMNGNIRALQARQPDSPALSRYDEVARIVTGIAGARAVDAVKWARELCAALAIPPLSALGMTEKEIPAAVDKARNARSMKGNPVTLTDNELTEILSRAM
jgi:alcohol dehydrogenase class IV